MANKPYLPMQYDPIGGQYYNPQQPLFSGMGGSQSTHEDSPYYLPAPRQATAPSILEQQNWNKYPATSSQPSMSGAPAPIQNLGDYYSSGFNPSAGETSSKNKDAKMLGTVSTIASLLPGVGSVISGLTGVGSLIMNWWGAKKQMAENKKAQAAQQAAYNAEQSESRRRYDIETGLKKKELAQQEQNFLVESNLANRKQTQSEAMDKATLAANTETKKWDRRLRLMQNMTNMMSTPGSRAGIAQLYKR